MFLVELSNTVSCVIDGVVTSRFLGFEQMAAYGLAAPYFSIAAICSGILMVGAQTLCAKSIGSGDRVAANRTFSTVCILGTVISVIAAVLGILFSDQLAMLFGARGEYASLLPHTSRYLKGLFVGLPFLVMMAVLAPIVQLDGGSKRANLASAMVSIADIAADLVGVIILKGSLLTVAVATSFSYFAALAVLLTHFAGNRAGFRLKISEFDGSTAKSILSDGMPRGASMLCRAIGPIIINLIALSVGRTAGMTALSVQSNVKFIINSPACGISGAVLLLSSFYVGEKDKTLLKETVAVARNYIFAIMVPLAAFTFVFSKPIAAFYLPDDPEIAVNAANAIRWYALSLPFMAVNISLACFLQSTGKTVGAYMMNIGSELVCTVTCVLVLSRIFGLTGIWAAFAAGQVLLLILYAVAVFLQKNRSDLCSDRFLFLRNDFGVSDDNRISSSLNSVHDVAKLSVEIEQFCKDRGIEKKRSFLAALFVEELADNVIEHGFNDGKKHILEAVVAVDNGQVFIHVHDDCRQFDLKEKAKNWSLDPEHPEQNVGIRMVLGLAKDVSYAGAMNTNNVFVAI